MKRRPRTMQRALGAAGLLSILLMSAPAHASGAMGLAGLAEGVGLVVALAALTLSAVLGALAWAMALRPPAGAGGVFGRGFLGVSAVVAFAVGGLALAFGLGLFFHNLPPLLPFVVLILATAFMAVEFFIAASLYRRTNALRPSTMARALGVASWILGVVFALATGLALVVMLVAAIVPGPPRRSAEVRRYERGCDAGDGSDCNMLGLRTRVGGGDGAPDPAQAAIHFQRACELGAAIGCRNLADLHAKGEGVPQSDELAGRYRQRYEELSAKRPGDE